MNIQAKALLVACLLAATPATAEQLELEPVDVTHTPEPDPTSQDTDTLEQGASNDTLGSYLDDLPNVDSASYGEAVGRPVVRGMSGYRIKILQNDHEVSDLSAMSQDHAVAVAPQASERIELLTGPASLLYAAQAGGVVRISDALDDLFSKPGLHTELSGDLRAEPSSAGATAHLHYANNRWAAHLGGLSRDSDPYESGDGQVVRDSDLSTQQAQLGFGWRVGDRTEVQFGATGLTKDYGIPNSTAEQTRIELQREDYRGSFRYLPDSLWLSSAQLSVHGSDYLHDETEDGRQDGLFGQQVLGSTLELEWWAGSWTGDTRLGVSRSKLRVCHEHGGCDDFRDAVRTGGPLGESIAQSVQDTGLPYSHGHPMPDTEDEGLQISTVVHRMVSADHALSLGSHLQWRTLTPDPDNIQEQWVHPESLDPDHYRRQSDQALSLSVGLGKQVSGNALLWDVSVSYLERFPSADELYWNGFHHATDTYIFGNVDLDKERSVNLDVELVLKHDEHRAQLSSFYYRFDDYIFQDQGFAADGSPLVDPFHLSEVWFTRQTDARFYGASLRYENHLDVHRGWPVTLWAQVDALSATTAGGEHLPRTAPTNGALGVVYDTPRWLASATVKRVLRSDNLAPNEDETEGYTWLSARLQRNWTLQDQAWQLWIMGENLLDADARNHLSVLKDTAPLPGRQVIAGIKWAY